MTRTEQYNQIQRATPAERDTLAQLAIGRILRLLSRPGQPGDVERYEDARAVILAIRDAAERDGARPATDTRPDAVRDRVWTRH